MTTLDQHWDEGGQWLKDGWHTVKVEDYDLFDYNTGSSGVSFQVQDEHGFQAKLSHVLLEKCFWTLASFAKACGLSREDAAKYDPDKPESHRVLIGKSVQVLVVPDGKYHKVTQWAEVGTPQADPPPPQRMEPVNPGLDDVPF